MIHAVQSRHVGHRVGVQKDQRELARVEYLILSRFKVALWPRRRVLAPMTVNLKVGLWVLGPFELVMFDVLRLIDLVVVLQLFAPAELLKHEHLVLAELGGLRKERLLLLRLCHVDHLRPVLFVSGFEVAQELIE